MQRTSPKSPTSWVVLALFLAGNTLFSTSASAEFFGCNDRTSRTYSHAPSYARAQVTTHEFAAQARPRVTISRHRALGPNAHRQCRAWLEKEFRVSGPVIVPKQRCWWE